MSASVGRVVIAIGSTNPVKVAAVKAILGQVFPQAEFVARSTPSGVAVQPWGEEETRQGAFNRAEWVRRETQATFGVGLEGGLKESSVGLMTCAWCVMLDADGEAGYGGGVMMRLPPIIEEMLHSQGELGPVMDSLVNEVNTKQKGGAIGILTNGLSTRQAAYEQLVAMAAAPFVTGYYRG